MAAKKTAASKATKRKSTKSTANTKNHVNEKVALNSQKRGSLKQTSILLLSGITALVLLALLSYNPADPGLFHHDSNVVVQNKAGSAGAYLADVLFGFLGYIAYLIPIVFIVSAFLLFRSGKSSNSGINLGITVFGVFLALVAGCGLATLLWPESTLVYRAGGLLGLGIAKSSVRIFGDIGATMILFSAFIAGITLFADIQWLKLVDKIGETILATIELFTTSSGQSGSYEAAGIPLHEASFDIDSNNDKDSNSSNNTSMFKAVTAGLTGLFVWKRASGSPETNLSGFDQQRDPLLDALDNSGSRQEPVLGVPDYMGQEVNSSYSAPDFNTDDSRNVVFDQEHESISGLDDVITSKRSSVKQSIKKLANKVTEKSTKQSNKSESVEKKPKPKQKSQSATVSLDKAITLPPVSLLNPPPVIQNKFSAESKQQLEIHAKNIVETLEHFNIRGVQIDSYHPGPIITRFELLLPPGTKVSRISGLAQDMARSMCVSSIRIVEVIPGKTTIGVEVPNEQRDLVAISEILDSNTFRESTSPLTMVLGKTISGQPAIADLSRMPHLLIAGTTGSGKSVGVNAMLISLLYKATPDEVKLILIDPKMLELSIYEGIPHLLTPVVTDMKNASNGLRWAVGEMERRYALMSHMKVRGITGYNEKIKEAIAKGEPIIDPTFDPTLHIDTRPKILEPLPYIVIVIDEFADMIMVVGKKVEELIARLAQKARAAGIHLILATQRPSVDVITGLIKANIPTRIAFQVSTKIDSRTILDQGGAESLLGHGDMLYLPPGTGLPQRVHGAFVADQEVEDVVNYLKLQGEPEYLADVIEETGSGDAIPGLEPLEDAESDVLYDTAVQIVTESGRASISYVQRRLKVGYNRAASMIEDMEQAGVVSAVQSNGTREVLAPEPVKN